jgi:drug/metabolite transporter (DMT)-like permease
LTKQDQEQLASRPGAIGLPELSQFAVVVMWASTFIITKDALDTISPLAFVFARFVLITALSLGVLAIRGLRGGWQTYWHIDRADVPRFASAGLFGYTIYQLGFTVGLDHASPFASSLLIAMMPLFSLVLITFLGERPHWSAWLGVGVAIAGVVIFLLDRTEGTSALGVALSLMAAVSFATYGVINRPLVLRYPQETVAAYATLIGAVPLCLIALPEALEQDWDTVGTSSWLTIVYMSIFPVYVAYMMWNWAIRQRGVSATGWSLLVPVVSGALSALLLGESFGPVKVAGGALAILGLVLMRPRPAGMATPAREAAA